MLNHQSWNYPVWPVRDAGAAHTESLGWREGARHDF